MKVIEITKPGGPEVLKVSTRSCPEPESGQVLIKVAFAGVNRPDALQRAGLYRPPRDASDLPGLEAAGEVVKIGKAVSGVSVGDNVCALLPGGGYAEYATTQAAHCLPIPDGFSLKQAACLPETFFTVWSNVMLRGGLKAGESFLVHGGSSGIGTTAIQLANKVGARVFATAGSNEKLSACIRLGAEVGINYKEKDFVEEIKKIGGVDVILDMVGGDYISKNLKCLNDDGRLVQIAFLQGSKVEVNFAQLMMRRLTFTGSTLRPQSNFQKAQIANDLAEKVWPLLRNGSIEPEIDSEFPLSDASEAHRRMESSAHIGKIVLKVG